MCRMNSLVVQDSDKGRNDSIHKSTEKAYRLTFNRNLEILFRNLCSPHTERYQSDCYMENMANLFALAARINEKSSGIELIDEDPTALFDKSWSSFCQTYRFPPETLTRVKQEIIEKVLKGTSQKQPLLNAERMSIVGPDTSIDVRNISTPGYQTPVQGYDPDVPPPKYVPGEFGSSSSSGAPAHTESEADRKRRMVESDEYNDELAGIFAQSESAAASASSSLTASTNDSPSQTQLSTTRINGVVRGAALEVKNDSHPNPTPSQPRTMPSGKRIINETTL